MLNFNLILKLQLLLLHEKPKFTIWPEFEIFFGITQKLYCWNQQIKLEFDCFGSFDVIEIQASGRLEESKAVTKRIKEVFSCGR